MENNYLDILYTRYYDLDGKNVTIGGIQTYIENVSFVAAKMHIKVRIFQYANNYFSKIINDDITLYGLVIGKKCPDNLYKEVIKTREESNHYVTLFATDTLIPSFKVKNSIAIQHGISWDQIANKRRSFIRSFLSKTINAYKIISHLQNVEKIICVDYNFICWYRTQIYERDIKLIPILNFAEIGPEDDNKERLDNDIVKIVFARRFVEYRGTRIFAEAITRLLKEGYRIDITFAGEGPDKNWLESKLHNFPVHFTTYKPTDSIRFHSNYDIAVVPTTGSEGTSLSLLEAMSAKCAVICTNVGGMTNIILDGFNGLMAMPTPESLYDNLKALLKDQNLRIKLSNNGYQTVKEAFSFEKWQAKWNKVLKESF